MKLDRGRYISALRAAAFCLLAVAGFVWSEKYLEASVERLGGEYSVLGRQVGDQFFSKLALNDSGGYLVWQDNNVDGDGLGIGAVELDANFNTVRGAFRVNQESRGDQQRPVVALLADGSGAFAWESDGDIRIRFVNVNGVFTAPEQTANTYRRGLQRDPAAASLDNGNVVVVWGSTGQDGSMQGVFGQMFNPQGSKIGSEFQVNQSTPFNQRNPSVAALEQGNFIVSWISEQLTASASGEEELSIVGGERYRVSVCGRVFDGSGNGLTGELLWGDPAMIDANPTVVAIDGGFMVLTSGHNNAEKALNRSELRNGWDIYGQTFDSKGTPRNERFIVNETTDNDQIFPAVASVGGSAFVTWTSAEQDGHREGVFGRVIHPQTPLEASAEFLINTEIFNKQLFPTAAGSGGQALVVWAGFSGGRDSFDLKAQKYAFDDGQPRTEAPFVFGAGFWSLGVSWVAVEGVEAYEVYLNGIATPVVINENAHTFTGLNAGAEYAVQIAYIFPDGSRSAKSPPGVARTWGRDENADGLPDDWQRSYWGDSLRDWPDGSLDSDGDGASNFDELRAGTNPSDAASLLRTEIVPAGRGWRLRWNTQPGGFYQAQVSTDLRLWFDAGAPRLAVDIFDSIPIGNDQGIAVYRVLRFK